MILTGENRSIRGETCPSVTLSTTNPTWNDRDRTRASAVRGRRLTDWLSHGTAHRLNTLVQGPAILTDRVWYCAVSAGRCINSPADHILYIHSPILYIHSSILYIHSSILYIHSSTTSSRQTVLQTATSHHKQTHYWALGPKRYRRLSPAG